MTEKRVSLGLCGAGRWGKRYLSTIENNPRLKIQGLFSRNPESRQLVPEDCFITPHWEELLERQDLDGIIIATPPSTHFDIAKAALKRRLPCMIEKPLCLNLSDALSLYELEKTSQTLVLVDHTLLFHPIYTELKKRLQDEVIEELRSEGSNWGPFREDCNPLWDYGAHDVAFCLDLLKAEPQDVKVNVTAQGSFETELTWENGVKAFIKSSNVEKKKTRLLEVKTKSRKFVFDDLATPESVQKPLDCALNFFADGIVGRVSKNDPRFGLGLAVGVVSTLERAQK
jgi:predicted dehydrogenase